MLPSMLTHSASASFIHSFIHLFIHSFIHSDHFYSASLGPLLLRSAPGTVRILCRSFTPKRHRQLRVKDLPKVPTRAGFEPTTLRTKGIESTIEPPRLVLVATIAHESTNGLSLQTRLESCLQTYPLYASVICWQIRHAYKPYMHALSAPLVLDNSIGLVLHLSPDNPV